MTPRRNVPGRPVADYEATDSVSIHTLAKDLAPALVSRLYSHETAKVELSTLGYQGPRSGYSDANLVWLRDFAPLFVEQDGQLEARKFLSLNPTRQNHTGASSAYGSKPPTEKHQLLGPKGEQAYLKVEQVPLLVDGGDLVPVGETLVVGERVLSRNSIDHNLPHLTEAGYQAREPEEVLKLLQESTGADQVVVIPWWPGDKTGHADMPVQALADGEVMIPEIPQKALEVLGYTHEREHGQRVQGYLNHVSGLLEDAGLKSHRLPMMAPVELSRGPYGWDAKSYTPANAYQGEGFICLATFDAQEFPSDYQSVKQSFEERWQDFYAERGLEVDLIDATRLGRANGLFHCLTASIPKVRKPDSIQRSRE